MKDTERAKPDLRTPFDDPDLEAQIWRTADALLTPALTAAFAEYRAGSLRGESVERRRERARACAAPLSDTERVTFAHLVVCDGVVLGDLIPEDELAYATALGELVLAFLRSDAPDMGKLVGTYAQRVPDCRRREFIRDAHGMAIITDAFAHA